MPDPIHPPSDTFGAVHFAVLPKRWVVERSFSWLEKNRRLWKNCERKLSTSLQMVALAFLGVLLRRL
ncbi:MAG: transposase [Cardiobacterium sp.]